MTEETPSLRQIRSLMLLMNENNISELSLGSLSLIRQPAKPESAPQLKNNPKTKSKLDELVNFNIDE